MRSILTCLFIFSCFVSNGQKDTLDVLTWNVFLRPAIMADKQMNRVNGIAYLLNESSADVLVLQETFHRRARKRLLKKLSANYPYHTEVGKKSFWGIPSGVLICSRFPINYEEHVYFTKAKRADALAKKGGVLAQLDVNGTPVHIIGTHMQAGNGKKEDDIRRLQFEELSALIHPTFPTLIAGDFNTVHETALYDTMIVELNASNFKPSGDELATANFKDHDLTKANGDPVWIDFILNYENNKVRVVDSYIFWPYYGFGGIGPSHRVSDHNIVHSSIVID